MNLNTNITYDKQRNDITFCTMLFKIPTPGALDSIKRMDRKFEEFYLPSIKRLIETFGRVCLWCDTQTAEYLREQGLDKQIIMRVMDFSELPHYAMRADWLKTLHGMKRHSGYLLHHKTPEQWVDYMILIAAKPAVVDFAAKNNQFDSKYFMWIDAGCFNPIYTHFWENWMGHIDARPTRCKFTIAPTMGKTRPAFVPKFLFNIYTRCQGPIGPATPMRMAAQDMRKIACINADYDVPATSFMIPLDMAHDFYSQFERVRKIMFKHNLVSTEQAVFQTMMKLDVDDMFEVSYIQGYRGVYAAVASNHFDCIL